MEEDREGKNIYLIKNLIPMLELLDDDSSSINEPLTSFKVWFSDIKGLCKFLKDFDRNDLLDKRSHVYMVNWFGTDNEQECFSEIKRIYYYYLKNEDIINDGEMHDYILKSLADDLHVLLEWLIYYCTVRSK